MFFKYLYTMQDNSNEEIIKKKRGRKKKSELIINTNVDNITLIIEDVASSPESILKKRGRKPKGGKLIQKQPDKINNQPNVANIILHLKCSTQDLDNHNLKINQYVTDPLSYNPIIPPNILSYNSDIKNEYFKYENDLIGGVTDPIVSDSAIVEEQQFAYNNSTSNICKVCNLSSENNDEEEDDEINIKDINIKLKKLKLQLYKSTNLDKKSACFWCTYDYDNQPCYIPKYEMDGELCGYGSFCRPECAVAYLMKESIDDSMKFERYHLLNQMYSKIYNYKKNIKPAPNPYFLLDKYFGNLSIQEYRKLLKTEHMLLVVDKPMTRILPELHEDSEDFIMNIYGGKQLQTNQTGVYKVKRQSEKQKGPSKSSIMKENFGF
jgi:hypothetical protein